MSRRPIPASRRPRRLRNLLVLAACLLPLCVTGAPARVSGATMLHMVYFSGPESDAMAQVISYWNTNMAPKAGFQVQMDLFGRTGFYEKENTLLAAHSSSEDVIFTASYEVGSMYRYLDPIGRGASGPGGKVDPSLFIPSTVDSLRVNGKLYAIPMDVSNHFLYYRGDLIAKLLRDPASRQLYHQLAQQYLHLSLQPKAPAAWTWDDFEAVALFYTRKYNPSSPTLFGTSLQLKNLIYNVMVWNDVLWSYGGAWNKGTTATLDTAAARTALSVYVDLYKLGCTPTASTDWEYPETNAAFETGRVAEVLQWSAAYHELTDPAKDPQFAANVGIAPVPGPVHRTHVHALAVGLNSASQNKAQAVAWLNFLGTAQAMRIYAQAGGIPSVSSVLASQTRAHPEYAEIARDVKNYGFSEPASPGESAILNALATDLSAAWAGQTGVDQALRTANSDVNRILRQGS